jgi:hypothetical protein
MDEIKNAEIISEVKKVDLTEFLKKARDTKKIILPESGLEIEIKKVFQKEWVSKMDTAFIIANENKSSEEVLSEAKLDAEKRKQLENMSLNICKLGCKYPVLTNIDTNREGELYINYISDADLNYICSEVLSFSGVAGKVPSDSKK